MQHLPEHDAKIEFRMQADPDPQSPALQGAPSQTLRGTLWRALTSLRAAVFITIIIGVSVPAWYSIYDESERLRQEHFLTLDDDLGRSATLLSMAMREPMWQFAPEQADSIIEAAFATDSRIISIVVRDYEGRDFAKRERPPPDDEPTIVHTRPITKDGKQVGVLLVEITSSGFQKKLDHVLQQYARRGLIALVGSLAFIALILHLRLVVPIDRLVEASERLARGTLDEKVSGSGTDELGRLAGSLEATRIALATLISTLEVKNNQLSEANDKLEWRVAERTTDLERALEQLKNAQRNIIESEKLASLGRVVAGVAHELNTPIGNALMVATSIDDHLKPLQTELSNGNVRKSTLTDALTRTEDGFVILLRNLAKAAQMIGDFKQVAVDQTSEQRRAFDLAEVTQEVLSTLQPAFKKTPYRIQTRLTPGIACQSFPGPYGQVLTNLVMNALIHAFEGRDSGDVTVVVDSPAPGNARLTVEDNGVGMSEEVKSKIFDPFFTTRLGRGGTGLGMNITHGFVVRVLKGSIGIESTPGGGSRFVVDFPCVVAEQKNGAS